MKLILASKSPRRKEILSMITNKFEIIVSNAEEIIDKKLTNEEQVKKLAYIKAKTVFDETKELGDRIIIGSDTIVVKDGKIYGKPRNHDEAFEMLENLQNAKHEVLTGLCILIQKNDKVVEKLDFERTEVYIGKVTINEIEKWIASNEAYDKAGGYAIQGKFGAFIEKINGDFYSVMGLPLHKVYDIIKEYIEY